MDRSPQRAMRGGVSWVASSSVLWFTGVVLDNAVAVAGTAPRDAPSTGSSLQQHEAALSVFAGAKHRVDHSPAAIVHCQQPHKLRAAVSSQVLRLPSGYQHRSLWHRLVAKMVSRRALTAGGCRSQPW